MNTLHTERVFRLRRARAGGGGALRGWFVAATIGTLSLVLGNACLQAQSAAAVEQPTVILYERAGARCAELKWQISAQEREYITLYVQELPSVGLYTRLISPRLDQTKSYKFLFEPPLSLYPAAGGSPSHRISPDAIAEALRLRDADGEATYRFALFCREDNAEATEIFPERRVALDAFLTALLYVSRKEKLPPYASAFRESARQANPTYLRNPAPRSTAMNALVKPRDAETLRAFDMAQLAEQYTRDGELDSAVLWYSRAIQHCPSYKYAYDERGHLYLHLEKPLEALSDFDNALALDSGNYHVWGNRCVALYRLDRYEEAIASANRALSGEPRNKAILLFRAWSFYSLDDAKRAAGEAFELIRLCLDTIGEDKEAVMEEALRLAWEAATREEWLDFFRRQAEYYSHEQKSFQAVICWNQVLKVEPLNYVALYDRFRCALAAEDEIRLEKTLEYCDSLFANAAPSDSAYALRGELRYKQKQHEQALEDFSAALDMNPNKPQIYIQRSKARYALSQEPDSVKGDIYRALALAPNNASLWHSAANYFWAIDQYDSAARYATRSIELDSSYYFARRLRAKALDELEAPAAIDDYSWCIHFLEDYDNTKEFVQELAELYRKRGRARMFFPKDEDDASVADSDLSESLRLYPTESAFWFRGWLRQSQNFYAEALKDYDSVLARNPASSRAPFSAAECYYYLKEYSASLSYLQRIDAAKLDSDTQQNYYRLRSCVKSELGDDEGACTDLHLAAKAGSKEAEAQLVEYCSGDDDDEENG